MLENRPWGSYSILHEGEHCKVKEIVVEPEQRLSYQSHSKRREVWTVTEGQLTVVLDETEYTLNPGMTLQIPLGSKHRAWNKTQEKVTFIEVQTGTYFGEDDIVRYQDDYKRE